MTTATPSDARNRSEPGSAWRDRAARLFEELRGPCAGMVRRAYGSTLGDDEIEDVYANAWMGTLRALETRQSRMDDEEVRRYVFTAVAHQAGKELRRRKRKPVAPLERAELVVDAAAAPDERADQREQSRITRDLLSSLPRRRRAVLLLRYGWGLEPAQVCQLIDGLSPRAYRKEITRGVDQLTQQMKKLEAGTWCEEREPVLKAFATGLADADQQRQAEHHLSHCRSCSEFVGRLNGHLHDLGASAALPGALDLAADGRVDVPDRIGDLLERARESVSATVARVGGSAPDAASLPGAAPRGAGAAGAGALAKLAGVGAAGKAALACVGGGAIAGMCVVAGVGPLDREDRGPDRARTVMEQAQVRARDFRDTVPPPNPAPEEPPEQPTPPQEPAPEPPAPEPAPEPVPVEPPPAPPETQQFGLAPTVSSSGQTSSSGSTDRGQAAAQEFGP